MDGFSEEKRPALPETPVAAGGHVRRESSLGRSPDTAGSSGRSAQSGSKGTPRANSKGRHSQSGTEHRDRRSLLARMQDEDRAYDDWAGYDDPADDIASSWSSRGSKGKRSGTKTIKLRSPTASAMGTSPGSAPGGYLGGSAPHRCVQTLGRDTPPHRPFNAALDDDEDLELAIALSRSLADMGGSAAASTSGGGGSGGGGGGAGEGGRFPFGGDSAFPASSSAPIAATGGGGPRGRPPLPGQGQHQHRASRGPGAGTGPHLGPGRGASSPGGGSGSLGGSPGPIGAWVSAPRIPRSRDGDLSYEALVELEDVRTTAPPEVVDALPIRIAGDGDEETAEKLCPICQEQFAAGDAILALSNCPHLLHRECGREWLLQYSKRCPTCKASVVPADAC